MNMTKEELELECEVQEYEKEQKRRQRIADEDYYNEGERHNFGNN